MFDLDEDFYDGFPSVDEKSIRVAGHRRFEALARPEEKDLFPPAAERIEALRRFVRERLPLASDQLARFSTCIYTMTPDEDFIIDRHPEISGLVFAAFFRTRLQIRFRRGRNIGRSRNRGQKRSSYRLSVRLALSGAAVPKLT